MCVLERKKGLTTCILGPKMPENRYGYWGTIRSYSGTCKRKGYLQWK